MARAILTSQKAPRPLYEPLYEIDRRTGATIEVFFADRALAQSFGARGAGWFWWTCQPGCLPEEPPTGPFATSYGAYRGCCYSLDGEIFRVDWRRGVFGRSSPLIRSVNADTVRTRRLQNRAVDT